jgi:holin-like protein
MALPMNSHDSSSPVQNPSLPSDLVGGLALLMGFQLLGEMLARALQLPIPGPVIGLAGLVLMLVMVRDVSASLEQTANGLLSRLAVMFVPAGVGVVQNLPLLGEQALALGVALVVSTAIGIGVTARVYTALTQEGHDS